jgi:hypothetical protein
MSLSNDREIFFSLSTTSPFVKYLGKVTYASDGGYAHGTERRPLYEMADSKVAGTYIIINLGWDSGSRGYRMHMARSIALCSRRIVPRWKSTENRAYQFARCLSKAGR